MSPESSRRLPIATLGLFATIVVLIIYILAMTARHNRQLQAQAATFNAQLMEQTERQNAQLKAQTEFMNSQLLKAREK